MNTVYILRGISGAGKSTYTKTHHPNAVVASADKYFIREGVYQFDPTKLGCAHQFSFLIFEEAILLGQPEIVVDNTNTKLWEFERYIKTAEKYGYEVQVIRLVCDPAIAASRNVHGVPESKVREMQNRFQDYPGETIVSTTTIPQGNENVETLQQ